MNKGIWIGIAVIVIAVVVGLSMNKKEEKASTMAPVTPSAEPAATDWRGQQKAYLEANAKKPGWKALPSGLQYMVVKGNADAAAPRPAPGSEVTVHYEGRLINGEIFDSSIARNEPATFPLSGVIMGWQEGVPLMQIGDIFEFAIPANMAYGERGVASIPPGSTLLFKIELLEVPTPAK